MHDDANVWVQADRVGSGSEGHAHPREMSAITCKQE
jgi:hypothetical protein